MSVFLYWNRTQQIDFSAKFPDTLNHCGKNISQNDAEYIELLNWFKLNKNGWKNTPVTYVPKNTFTSPTFSVNILGNGVIVNYQTNAGAWRQVEKQKKHYELPHDCSKANKAN